jgi:tetratricopeptide (TPR) repeat protein
VVKQTALSFTAIIAFLLGVYLNILNYFTFGPELAGFYGYNVHRTLQSVIWVYTYVAGAWYRPTAFVTPYWIGQHFVSWHNTVAWKLIDLANVAGICFLIYWLVLLLFPGKRLAAFLAALYYAASPCLYIVVLEISAFDFVYIFFVLLTVILYILAYRASGYRAIVLTGLSCLAYVIALTGKEISLVTPVYLCLLSAIFLWRERESAPWKTGLRQEALRLLPFFLVLGLYAKLHILTVAGYYQSEHDDYRTKTNVGIILQNAIKYPLWMAGIFSGVKDKFHQAICFENLRITTFGIVTFASVLLVWVRSIIRSVEDRYRVLILLGWIAIFVAIPVYSGGYLWHANLALAGYAIFFGAGFARILGTIRLPVWKGIATTAFTLILLLMARANVDDFLKGNFRREIYRMNYQALKKPPVPASRIPGDALIYVEDRRGLGAWAYGGGNQLFKYVYLNTELKEDLVPDIDVVTDEQRAKWLANPHSFFFRFTSQHQWVDVSDQFRRACIKRMTEVSEDLFRQKRAREVAGFLQPMMHSLSEDGTALYHYALSLQTQGRREEAEKYLRLSNERLPQAPAVFLARAQLYGEQGEKAQACADAREAGTLNAKDLVVKDSIRRWCR